MVLLKGFNAPLLVGVKSWAVRSWWFVPPVLIGLVKRYYQTLSLKQAPLPGYGLSAYKKKFASFPGVIIAKPAAVQRAGVRP